MINETNLEVEKMGKVYDESTYPIKNLDLFAIQNQIHNRIKDNSIVANVSKIDNYKESLEAKRAKQEELKQSAIEAQKTYERASKKLSALQREELNIQDAISSAELEIEELETFSELSDEAQISYELIVKTNILTKQLSETLAKLSKRDKSIDQLKFPQRYGTRLDKLRSALYYIHYDHIEHGFNFVGEYPYIM